uniref:Putative cephalosporin hydroxylase n=1 Tax=viral metagenome TaxID=1070528 RepID=A0A6M3MFR3_9ZZZZ
MDRFRARHLDYRLFGEPVQQVPSAVYWLDQILDRHKVAAVAELGTGCGGLTVMFGCRCPGAVITCDEVDRRSDRVKELHKRLEVKVVQADLYEPTMIPSLVDQAQCAAGERPVLVFCDGGDKPRELRTVAALLRPGDLAAVDDTGNEFHPGAPDVAGACTAYRLTRILAHEMQEDRTRLTVYRKEG